MADFNPGEFGELSVTVDGQGVLWASLDSNGCSQNVLSRAMLTEIERIVSFAERKAFTAVVFGFAKQNGFCVGADITGLLEEDRGAGVAQAVKSVQRLFCRIRNAPIPIVCIVDGICLGGDLEFALACHARVAVKDVRTRFGMPEVKIRLLPCFGASILPPEKIGRATRIGGIA